MLKTNQYLLREAEQFIAAFDQKAAAGREKLKGIVDENTTVGILERRRTRSNCK